MKKFNKNLIIGSIAVLVLGLIGTISVFAFVSPAIVNLGTAGNFDVLAKTGVSTTGATSVGGDIGISPAAASFLTGFSQTMDASNKFSTSTYSSGKLYASDYTVPTPSYVGTAVSAMEAAYTDATGRTANETDRLGGTLPLGNTFTTGVYKWNSNVNITGDITLSGSATDIFIFQITGNLDIASGKKVILSGVLPSNVFWAVAGTTTLETTSTFEGNILGGPGASTIAMLTNSTLHGKVLGQTDVTLDAATIASAAVANPQLTVVKVVVNDNGRNSTITDFPLFVDSTSVVSGIPNSFPSGTHNVTETNNANYYAQTFSASCPGGAITLFPGDNVICTITNNDIAAPVSSGGSSGSGTVYGCTDPSATNYSSSYVSNNPALCIYTRASIVPSIIDLVKIPSPLALPSGPGSVIYTYTVSNIGTVPMSNITVVDDSCSPMKFISGDINANNKLDVSEKWIYQCSSTLSSTHTNNAVATGWANGISTTDIASATVVVGKAITPPLIHITKVPSPLALLAGPGIVTYTEKITNPGVTAISNIVITDDKCSPLNYISGDLNNDSKLDTNETWTYTCKTNLTKTTTNTARVEGTVNGLIAKDFAIVTVVVSTPGLPKTGFPPRGEDMMWKIITLAGMFTLVATSFVVLKKRKI